jgi:hypothetical protein
MPTIAIFPMALEFLNFSPWLYGLVGWTYKILALGYDQRAFPPILILWMHHWLSIVLLSLTHIVSNDEYDIASSCCEQNKIYRLPSFGIG